MEVDVVKQENQEFMEKSISLKNGFEQVKFQSLLSGSYIDVGDEMCW